MVREIHVSSFASLLKTNEPNNNVIAIELIISGTFIYTKTNMFQISMIKTIFKNLANYGLI